MALTNAERQRRYRRRRKAHQPAARRQPAPTRSRSRPQRWHEAVRTLLDLQAEYQAWLDNLPASLQESALAEKLEQVCALDLVELESVELPRGFGRD